MLSSMFQDKKFFSTMLRLARPIILQNLIFSSLSLVDGLMIGQLGDDAVAAVGVANQVFFLVSLLLFGITSGTAIFTAQYWGQKDIHRIRSVLGLSLVMSTAGSLLFSLVAILIPTRVIGIYTTDPNVITLGSPYLHTVAFSYVLSGITYPYSAVLRSTENVRLPMLVSLLALSLNTFLNYCLILGNFGFPALGVYGAAIATVIARLMESVLLLVIIYHRQLSIAARLSDLINFGILPLGKLFKTIMPVIATEIVWSLGSTTYNVVYAHLGTESIAAYNIAVTLDRLIFVVFIGLGSACAIMIGNRLGAGERDVAAEYGKKYLAFNTISAVILSFLMIGLISPLLALYKVSVQTSYYTSRILLAMALSLPVRSSNFMLLIGILRSGGDTRYAFIIDAGVIWIIGVPLAFLGAYLLHLPIYLLFPLVLTEEVVKLSLGLYRFFSGRWIHSLTVQA
jgi:putative MATE family efflux protein